MVRHIAIDDDVALLPEREPLVVELREIEAGEALALLEDAVVAAEFAWRRSGDPVDVFRWSAAVEDLALAALPCVEAGEPDVGEGFDGGGLDLIYDWQAELFPGVV